MSPFATYLLVVVGVIAVIAMNYSLLTDESVRRNGLLSAFKHRKLYIWFAVLVVIFFSVFLLNV